MADRMGNVLSNYITNRRTTENTSITKEFGQRVLARYPGMGAYIARQLFGTEGRETEIKFSLEEIKKLTAMNSHGGAKLLNGTGGSRWPIAPLYDYLLTLDQTVGDMYNEMDRIRSLAQLGSTAQEETAKRVLMPDYRPLWYHKYMELGTIDSQGNIMTEGQALGSDLIYEGTEGPAINPNVGDARPHTRRKSAYELACDNAMLLTYSHLNAIVSLCQGLFRVQFTVAPGLDFDQSTGYNNFNIPAGNWINAGTGSVGGTNIAGVAGKKDMNRTLAAQTTNLKSYVQNRFQREPQAGPPVETVGTPNLDAEAAQTPAAGGAMYTHAVWRTDAQTMSPQNQNPVPTDAITITDDMFRQAFAEHTQHPIQYCQTFKELCRTVKIEQALRNVHADMQVLFADVWARTRRSAANPSDHHALGMRTGCPTGSYKVFKNRKGQMVNEYVNIPGRGNIKNPEVHGIGTCTPFAPQGRRVDMIPGLEARSSLFDNGLPHTSFSANTSSIGELFGAQAKRRKKRKTTTAKKRVTRKKTAKRKPKVTKTNRKFRGRAVFQGEQGGSFVRMRSATTGEMVKRYI